MASQQFTSTVDLRYGVGALDEVTTILADAESKKVLVVADKGVRAAGLVDRLVEKMGSGVDVQIFDELGADPTDTMIMNGVEAYRAAQPDMVFGLGGGSSMDSAKAIRGVAECGGTINDYEGFNEFHGVMPKSCLVCIPTTSGTGGEVGCWAMVTDSTKHSKMAIADSVTLMPTFSIVDPELTVGLPARLTGETGMDAFSHAMEAYVTVASSPVSDALAIDAIARVARSLRRACAAPDDVEARADMAYASMIAGIAMNNADVGAVHAIGHVIGAEYGLGHGLCMGVFSPYVMKLNVRAVPAKMATIASAVGTDTRDLSEADAAQAAWRGVAALAGEVGLPRPKEMGIKASDVERLAGLCLQDPCSPGNPVEMSEQAYVEVLEEALATDLW